MPESSTKPIQKSSSALDRLRQLLGDDIVFLPCPPETKGPAGLTGWNKWTVEDTERAVGDGRFEGGAGVALLLGERTGLYAIDIDDDTDLETFLALNPDLRETFTVRGERGAKLIVRADAPPFDGKDITADGKTVCEVLQGNATIAGTHPAGMEYRDNDKPAMTVSWDAIVWPEGWTIPGADRDTLLDRLKERYGEPYRIRTDNDGNEIVCGTSERFWSAVLREEINLVWLPEAKEFYIFDEETRTFAKHSDEEIRERFAARLMQASREEGRPEIEGLLSTRMLRGLTDAARGVCAFPGFFEDAIPGVHLENGFLRAGDRFELEEAGPEHRSRTRIPFSFDDTATCPRYLEFLAGTVGADDILLLQKMAGLVLLGNNIFQRILILHGPGGSGKTTFALIVCGLLGRAAVAQLRTELLAERFEIARFRGRCLLYGADVKGNFLSTKGASVLKSLVGGDEMTVEMKGGNDVLNERGQWNALITANTRLRVRLDGDLSAWRRRLLIVEFTGKPPDKKITNLADDLLQSEGAGILRWALTGLRLAMQDDREQGDIVLGEAQRERIEGLLAESESLKVFVETEVRSEPGAAVTTESLVRAYFDFCDERGWSPIPATQAERDLTELMMRVHGVGKAHDIPNANGKKVRGFRGVTT